MLFSTSTPGPWNQKPSPWNPKSCLTLRLSMPSPVLAPTPLMARLPVEPADLVAGLGDERGADDVEGDVVVEVDVARVVDEPPAGAVDDDAVLHLGRLLRREDRVVRVGAVDLVDAGPVEVDRVPSARVEAGPGHELADHAVGDRDIGRLFGVLARCRPGSARRSGPWCRAGRRRRPSACRTRPRP